jgi:hypothetical protein
MSNLTTKEEAKIFAARMMAQFCKTKNIAMPSVIASKTNETLRRHNCSEIVPAIIPASVLANNAIKTFEEHFDEEIEKTLTPKKDVVLLSADNVEMPFVLEPVKDIWQDTIIPVEKHEAKELVQLISIAEIDVKTNDLPRAVIDDSVVLDGAKKLATMATTKNEINASQVLTANANASDKSIIIHVGQHFEQKVKHVIQSLNVIPATNDPVQDILFAITPNMDTKLVDVVFDGSPNAEVLARVKALLMHPSKSFENWKDNNFRAKLRSCRHKNRLRIKALTRLFAARILRKKDMINPNLVIPLYVDQDDAKLETYIKIERIFLELDKLSDTGSPWAM